MKPVRSMLCCLFVTGLSSGGVHAAPVTWVVESSQSSLSISGALSSGGTLLASMAAQAPGSTTAAYSGTIHSEIDLPSGTMIEFTSANLDAEISGNWDPLPFGSPGTFPANYGGKFDLGFLGGSNLAIRNLIAEFSSGALSLSGPLYSPQTFNGNLTMELVNGTVDFRGYGIVGGGLGYPEPTPITGQPASFATTGTFIASPNWGIEAATLIIPISYNFASIAAGADTTQTSDDVGIYMNLSGTITAYSVVPEASSLVLLGIAGSVLGFMGYRRQRRAAGF